MMDLRDIDSYNVRRQRLFERFQTFRHGAQMDASHDLWLSPSMVSGILRGRYIDDKKLAQLEKWAEENAEEYRAHDTRKREGWARSRGDDKPAK